MELWQALLVAAVKAQFERFVDEVRKAVNV